MIFSIYVLRSDPDFAIFDRALVPRRLEKKMSMIVRGSSLSLTKARYSPGTTTVLASSGLLMSGGWMLSLCCAETPTTRTAAIGRR